MRFVDAAIPAGFAWSSPFARWQGPLAGVPGLELAAAVTRRALDDRGLDAAQVDGLVLGWTVPQPDQFFGAPLLAGRIGAPGISGPMVSQACATTVAALQSAAAEVDDESEDAPEPIVVPTAPAKPLAPPRLTLGGDPALLAILKPGLKTGPPPPEPYDPVTAAPTEKLKQLMVFRAVHPLYGLFLLDYFARADDAELIQILESVLAIPGSVAKAMRVPWPDRMPPGPLATEVVDPAILTSGLATHDDMYPPADQSDVEFELRKYPVPLAAKMKMLFENTIDHAGGLYVTPVWAVGDLLERGGNFDDFVRSRDLVKQEGIVFKHLLRMILLCEEFKQLTPVGTTAPEWDLRLRKIAEVLTTACREVDPQSTDEMLEETGEA